MYKSLTFEAQFLDLDWLCTGLAKETARGILCSDLYLFIKFVWEFLGFYKPRYPDDYR